MMPLPFVLQCFDAAGWDVAVIRKPRGSSYLRGLRGESDNFVDFVRHLENVTCRKQYRRVVTLGTSGGGFAAILAALFMDAACGVSIGGGSVPKSYVDGEFLVPQVRPQPDLRYVYGADYQKDRDSAISMAKLFGGSLYPIDGADVHNVLKPLLERGRLAKFLSRITADSMKDRGSVFSMVKLFGKRLYPNDADTNEHDTLRRLLRRGPLAEFLSRITA